MVVISVSSIYGHEEVKENLAVCGCRGSEASVGDPLPISRAADPPHSVRQTTLRTAEVSTARSLRGVPADSRPVATTTACDSANAKKTRLWRVKKMNFRRNATDRRNAIIQ